MSKLNPTLNTDIGYERPVQQAPSMLGSLVGTVGGLLDTHNRNKPTPRELTADERKNQALSPLANQLDEIYSMDISQNDRERMYSQVIRSALVENPQLRTDIAGLGEQYGYELMQEDQNVQVEAAYQEWQQTPVGQAAMATLAVGNGSGGIDQEATRQRVQEYYLEQQTEVLLATNLANSQAGDERKFRQLSFNWAQQSADFAEGLVVQASQSEEFLKNPEQVMQLLNSTLIAREAAIRESAQLAGISPQYIDENISSVLAPINNLRDTYNNMADDTTKMIRALETAQQHGVVQQFIELNPVFADEAARNVFLQYFIAGNFTEDTASQFFDTVKNVSNSGRMDVFNLSLSTVPSNQEIVAGGPAVNPESIATLRQELQDNPEQANQELNMYLSNLRGANVSTDSGKAQFELAMMNTTLLSEALDRPIGYETLNQLLSPDVIRNAMAFGEGSNVQTSLLSLISRQVSQHRRAIDSRSGIILAVENDRFVALREPQNFEQRTRGPRAGSFDTTGNVIRPDGLIEITEENPRGLTSNVRALNVLWNAAKGDPLIRDNIRTQIDLTNSGHPTTPEIQTLNDMAGGRDGKLRTIVVGQNAGGTGISGYERVANDTPFVQGVAEMAGRLGADPVHIMQAISFETVGTFDPSIRNPGSSATGLIQFIESTARELGTSTEKLATMDRTQQLKYVEKYLQRFSGRLNNLGDVYMAIHWPRGVGQDDTFIMYRKGDQAYEPNANLDVNGDGVITRGEALARVVGHNGGAMGQFPNMSNAGSDGTYAPDGNRMDRVRPTARPDDREGMGMGMGTTVSTRGVQQSTTQAPETSQRPQARPSEETRAASRKLTSEQRAQMYSRLREGGEIEEVLAEILGEDNGGN